MIFKLTISFEVWTEKNLSFNFSASDTKWSKLNFLTVPVPKKLRLEILKQVQ